MSHALDVGPTVTDMHPRLFNALRVLILTGCRASEITGLEVDEVVLMHKVIHLKNSKTGARDVKLSDAVIPYLQTALDEAEQMGSKYVFPGIGNNNRPPLLLFKHEIRSQIRTEIKTDISSDFRIQISGKCK